MTIEKIRDMPITTFMHKLGMKSTKKRGNEVLFHAPYRSDKTPSFCVNTEKKGGTAMLIISWRAPLQ